MNKTSSDRIIHTGLYSSKVEDILSSVFGQLSDGWGENSPTYDKYWKFGNVCIEPNGEVTVHVKTASYETVNLRNGKIRTTMNGFYDMSDTEVKAWLAKMLKKTVKLELDDCCIACGWRRDNVSYVCNYIGHNRDCSIAEIYFVYDTLLERANSCDSKYDIALKNGLLGTKRSERDTKAEEKRRKVKELLKADCKLELDKLNAEEKALISEIQESFIKKRQAVIEAYDAASTEKCIICGEKLVGHGNNAQPYAIGRCCDNCNNKFVLPARLQNLNAHKC